MPLDNLLLKRDKCKCANPDAHANSSPPRAATPSKTACPHTPALGASGNAGAPASDRRKTDVKYGYVRIGTETTLLEPMRKCEERNSANVWLPISITSLSVMIRTYPYPSVPPRQVRGRAMACASACRSRPFAAVLVCTRPFAETLKWSRSASVHTRILRSGRRPLTLSLGAAAE